MRTTTAGRVDARVLDSVILARAPLRVSLAGGGTDLPSFADRHGGLVLSVAITRYVSVTVFPRTFDGGVRSCGDDLEHATHVDDLGNRFTRAALLRRGIHAGVQVVSCADAPSGTGLGGSGAYTVALVQALGGQPGRDRAALAEEAAEIEMTDLQRPVGRHDHYMAAFGGIRALHLRPDRRVVVEDLAVPASVRAYLRDRLLLFYTGLSRDAGQVLAGQDRMTRHGDRTTVTALHEIRRIAAQMLDVLRSGQVDAIGPLLHEHWRHKTRLSAGVSNRRVDELYRLARAAGSDGGKLLGAGGGGFLLISVRPSAAGRVRAAMAAEAIHELPFDVDDHGSLMTALPV
jgi:D-glycero-alpha-D-manno-heptose-7-phosphate kinase